jgi:preprotein translocase SecE subunit
MATENTKKNKNEGNILTRPFMGIFRYLDEVRTEMRKVTWPEREEVIRLSSIVLAVTLASALILGFLSLVLNLVIIDYGLNQGQEWIFGVMFLAMFAGAFYIMWRGGEGRNY